jgi:spore coat polysaccharide biosynthesis predicted glycosyltransferase SpsG/CMP-N-acetylneuraminic acid synthetase
MARSGNEYLARQNLRLVNDKPLLYYIIKTSLEFKNADVYVTTDSEEIKELSLMYGSEVILRPKLLTKQSTTLEDIAFHSLTLLSKKNIHYQKCLLITPKFPLIKKSTIKDFFKNLDIKVNTIFGYLNNFDKSQKINNLKNNIEQLNDISFPVADVKKIVSFNCDQFLKSKQFTKPFFGQKLSNYEYFTLLNYHDIGVLETLLKRKKILIRVDGSREIGLGHIYNMLTILNNFRNDDLLIVMNSSKQLGSNLLKEHLYKIKFFSSHKQLQNIIEKFKPDIIFNDILNTSIEYMIFLKNLSCFVVNFEDLGSGKKHANLVFNAIYFSKSKNRNEFYGNNFAAVRDEFRIWESHVFKPKVNRILITFGGSDPTNRTQQILKIISTLDVKQIEFTVILGLGYSHKKSLEPLINSMRKNGFQIKIVEKSHFLAKYFRESDFAIASNGRTIFELAALRIPVIAIPVNKRELHHSFVLHADVGFQIIPNKKNSENEFVNAFNLMLNPKKRQYFIKNLKKLDLLNGVNLITNKINQEFEKYKTMK